MPSTKPEGLYIYIYIYRTLQCFQSNPNVILASKKYSVVNVQGIEIDPTKVEIVRKWPKPTGVHEVRQYFGLANCFSKDTQGFANMCRHLHRLTENGRMFSRMLSVSVPLPLGKKHQSLSAGSSSPLFMSHLISSLMHLDLGIGAVLMQNGWRIAFKGWKMTLAETEYTNGEQ